jgi:hypothetical protein
LRPTPVPHFGQIDVELDQELVDRFHRGAMSIAEIEALSDEEAEALVMIPPPGSYAADALKVRQAYEEAKRELYEELLRMYRKLDEIVNGVLDAD